MEILKLLFVLNKEVVGLRFFFKNFFSKLLGFSLNIFLFKNICSMLVSLVAQVVKNSPAVQETWVQSLGWEVPLEKEMATDSRILAWEVPWSEEPGGLQPMGSQRVDMPEWLTHTQHVRWGVWWFSVHQVWTAEGPGRYPCPILTAKQVSNKKVVTN